MAARRTNPLDLRHFLPRSVSSPLSLSFPFSLRLSSISVSPRPLPACQHIYILSLLPFYFCFIYFFCMLLPVPCSSLKPLRTGDCIPRVFFSPHCFVLLFTSIVISCDSVPSLFDANLLNAATAHPAGIYLAAPRLPLRSFASSPNSPPWSPLHSATPFSQCLCASVFILFFHLPSCLSVSLFACFCLSVGFLEYERARIHTQIQQQSSSSSSSFNALGLTRRLGLIS